MMLNDKTLITNGYSAEAIRADNDLYSTPTDAVRMLLMLESFGRTVWEPACGLGHISNTLEQYHFRVTKSDIIDRIDNAVVDFLKVDKIWYGDIITNPPYSKALDFVKKAIEITADGYKIAMFLKLTFLEGKARRKLFDEYPPKTVYVSSSRLNCLKNGKLEYRSSAIAYAWFVWEKGYKGETTLKWFN